MDTRVCAGILSFIDSLGRMEECTFCDITASTALSTSKISCGTKDSTLSKLVNSMTMSENISNEITS